MPLNFFDKLSVGHCNIQGGLTSLAKCLDIQNLIWKENLDILCLNETNLKSDIDSNSLALPKNFSILRKDRCTDNGRGGCGILISNNVKFSIIQLDLIFPTDNIEAIWIHLVECNIYLCCFYRSEKFCPLDTFLDFMSDCMMKLGTKSVIWFGDVNVDQNNLNSMNYKKLDITMKLFGLVQTVQEVTRIAQLGDKFTESTIDVIMTNTYSNFLDCKVLDEKIGDHQAVKFVLDFNIDKASKFKKLLIRDHCKSNINGLRQFLTENSDYQPILDSNNVNEAAEGLNTHIQHFYDLFCPIKQIKCHTDYIHKPSDELLRNINLKRKLNRKFRKHQKDPKKAKKHLDLKLAGQACTNCEQLWEAYRVQRNITTRLSRENVKKNVITDLLGKSAMNDLKGVWKTIKKASNLPTKATNTNNNLNAEETNNFFARIGSDIQSKVNQSCNGDDFTQYLDGITSEDDTKLTSFDEITESVVLKFINSIPSDKSTNDHIPLRIFKKILPSFISPFTHIVNLSLTTGVMPDCCKVAIVTPIHKSGDTENPSNYRPISILPVLSKTIEYAVNSQLTQYLDDTGSIASCQYGFRKDHSTTYLMLDLFDKIFNAKTKQRHPGIIFLDIKKAFDTVNHDILLAKLKNYGVSGLALKWFESYLIGRKQQTRVGSRISDLVEILSGVPQGSILGPILFSIFINDLPTACIESTPYLFADDGALYFDNIKRGDYANVKLEIQSIFKWLQANKLALNNDKTKLLIFDTNPNLDAVLVNVRNDLTLVICECKSQKYLGLIVDNKLNFYEHIDYIKKKVAKRIGAMYRSKNLLPSKYRKMFANALMLPHFDHLDIIWCKTFKGKLKELDIIYKKVAKIALDVTIRESSIEVYKNMSWLPLHLRRQLHLSSYMFRILNETCPDHFIEKFSYISGGSRDGGNCNLYTQKSRSHKEFFYLGAKAWNMLPQQLRESESIYHFKKAYKTALLSTMINDDAYQTDNTYDIFYPVTWQP